MNRDRTHPRALAAPRKPRPAPPRPSPGDTPITVPGAEGLDVLLVRSARRKKTVSARFLNWHTLEITAPAHVSDAELAPHVAGLVQRALERRAKRRTIATDDRLEQRAQALNRLHFGGQLRWRSISFAKQDSRYGSCSLAHGAVRISHRLAHVPAFVLDYVIMHELAHFIEPNHSAAFWELVNRFPKTERARGYLMALEADAGPGTPAEDVTDED
ncbi:MAG: M48 family metallopeptidase [Chloroflexota bacterium]